MRSPTRAWRQKRNLPTNWNTLRQKVFQRDGNRCVHLDDYGRRCASPAEECDHIGDNSDHSMDNLRSLCSWHHAKRTSQQGHDALRKRQEEISQRFRRTEPHPGLR